MTVGYGFSMRIPEEVVEQVGRDKILAEIERGPMEWSMDSAGVSIQEVEVVGISEGAIFVDSGFDNVGIGTPDEMDEWFNHLAEFIPVFEVQVDSDWIRDEGGWPSREVLGCDPKQVQARREAIAFDEATSALSPVEGVETPEDLRRAVELLRAERQGCAQAS